MELNKTNDVFGNDFLNIKQDWWDPGIIINKSWKKLVLGDGVGQKIEKTFQGTYTMRVKKPPATHGPLPIFPIHHSHAFLGFLWELYGSSMGGWGSH